MSKREKVKLEDVCNILDAQRIPITASAREHGQYPYYGANGIQDYVSDYIFNGEFVLIAEDGGNFGSKTKPIAYRVSGKCWVNNHAHVLSAKSNINIDYLCYSLMFYDVSKIISGTTRAKLNQAALRKMEIHLPPLEEQHKIASILDTVSEALKLRKQQLNELDLLVKSKFVEMFGDPETNTKNFPIIPLSQIAIYYNGLTYKPENVEKIGTIVLRSSNIQNSQLDFTDIVRVNCSIQKKLYVQENDILMCSRNGSAKLVGKVALIKHIKESMSFGAFMMIIRSEYYMYLMTYFQMEAFRRQIKTGATTTINQITGKMLNQIELPIPPKAELSKFASFVQHVDKLKSEVQKSIDQLQTLFDSLMQQYFE